MLKPFHSITTAFTAASLIIVEGCYSSQPSQSVAPSPQTDSSQVSVVLPSNAQTPTLPDPIAPASGVSKPPLVSPDKPDLETSARIQQYLSRLGTQGFSEGSQGVWLQTGNTLLANHQGTLPLPAASLTKVATTLASLQTFGSDHRFVTLVGTTGTIQDGRLEGDLVIQGGEDPFFVWEEAIAVGNLLNQMNVRSVSGNLVIVGKFYMNYEQDPLTSGNLLRQGLDSSLWNEEAETQYQTLPAGTARPQVAIAGSIEVATLTPNQFRTLIRHSSLPLTELLKKMNQYSNNLMAEMFAEAVGGAKSVAQKAAQAAGVPPTEISLINGSGLGLENRISPRAVCAMFLAIEHYLQSANMTVADVFTVVGKDEGVLEVRQLPRFTVVKSGSLDSVSALAGALPTQNKGVVWFSIINEGNNLAGFRAEQEQLLYDFLAGWGAVPALPEQLSINPQRASKASQIEVMK